jgi:hypothetical protein
LVIRAPPRTTNRLFVEAVLWIARTGSPWRDLPDYFGKWYTIYMPIIAPVHDDAEIETTIIAPGREPGGGLVVMLDNFTLLHRAPLISAASWNNVPAV